MNLSPIASRLYVLINGLPLLFYFFCLVRTWKNWCERRKEAKAAWKNVRLKIMNAAVEAQAPLTHKCIDCKNEEKNIFRCIDCSPTLYMCESCIVKQHKYIFFHKPEMWTVSKTM